MNVIECKNLTKQFGRKKALNQLTFTLEDNKITGLIGRNGAGKTTLLKMLTGFSKKTSGDLAVFSEDPYNNLLISANSIYVSQEMNLPESLKLGEILKEAGRFYPNWDQEFAIRLFDYFSLNREDYHSNLSKGMTSTFNAILGLASRAPLTIFDEPTNGMDAAVRKDFYRAVLKDYIALPRSIIISSHHLEEIEDLIEDILLLKNGKTYLHMSIADLKEWAIGLKGESAIVESFIKNKDILIEQQIGIDQLYVVLENNFQENEIQEMKRVGIETKAVSANDICIYLTNQNKGGIDDVFS